MNAYNIEPLVQSVDRTLRTNDGWCYGLPPGISPDQWPLDPTNGYPLMHGFTVRLPEEYRVHGPDIVALSFFAVAPEHNDGSPTVNATIAKVFREQLCPSDDELVPFWRSIQKSHPTLARMTDELGCPYACILLTQAEFDGPWCWPRLMDGNRHLAKVRRPTWLDVGAARSRWERIYRATSGRPPEEYGLYRFFGQVPDKGLAFNRAISLKIRACDPNAGKNVRDHEDSWYLDGNSYRRQSWTTDHMADHIGGTMRSSQQSPQFSAYYIEFEESLGGYNFGGGNAQLDFRDMKFEWACG